MKNLFFFTVMLIIVLPQGIQAQQLVQDEPGVQSWSMKPTTLLPAIEIGIQHFVIDTLDDGTMEIKILKEKFHDLMINQGVYPPSGYFSPFSLNFRLMGEGVARTSPIEVEEVGCFYFIKKIPPFLFVNKDGELCEVGGKKVVAFSFTAQGEEGSQKAGTTMPMQ